MQQIRDYFEETLKMTDEDWQIFSSKLTKREFPRKHILLESGNVENHLSFIESGIARFYIPKENNDLTFSFAFANSFLSGYDSFLTRNPSLYNIETLTKTTLWQLTYENLEIIYKETQIGNALGRQASELLFLKKSKRELSLLNDSSEERYQKLFTEQPELIRLIPLKYIASYIGVAPQTLSRIRRQLFL